MTRSQRGVIIAGAVALLALMGANDPAQAMSNCHACSSSCQEGFDTQQACDLSCFGWTAMYCMEDTFGYCEFMDHITRCEP